MIYSFIFILIFLGAVIAIVTHVKKGNKPAQEADNDLETSTNKFDMFDELTDFLD